MICESVKDTTFPIAEICLAIATLFAGASISSLISGIQLQADWKAIVFYVVSPMIVTGCLVAYFLTRKREEKSKADIVKHILEYIPEELEDENNEH